MNRYIIAEGLPYLLADDGKIYAVRWDAQGYTVGAEVKLASVPEVTFSELSIKAKCADHLDSIGAAAEEKPKASRKKKAVASDDSDGQ